MSEKEEQKKPAENQEGQQEKKPRKGGPKKSIQEMLASMQAKHKNLGPGTTLGEPESSENSKNQKPANSGGYGGKQKQANLGGKKLVPTRKFVHIFKLILICVF